ncbi:MAG TPA: UDP-glucose 4-epimerase GalE [Acidimicrobiales bacterium]|nr:UDP-glucose 4-epimerase GalE [Acidimicrobiales bacterium]
MDTTNDLTRARVLITGGTGFVGSHVAVALAGAGAEVELLDNLCHSSPNVVDRLSSLTGVDVPLHRVDLRRHEQIPPVFSGAPFDAVVHCAGLKSVAESISRPLDYYDNNVVGTLNLLRAMDEAGCRRLVFSSSATVYSPVGVPPLDETAPIGPINPYGRTKSVVEGILEELCEADPAWSVYNLRYFNPVGAHPSGRIGEDPNTDPANLVPRVLDVALGVKPEIAVYGSDYDTPDGTCIRDYIHVCDLAEGHVAAVARLDSSAGCRAVNLGTGTGHSVLEVVDSVRRVSGREVPIRPQGRRSGDQPISVADASLAETELGWSARRGLDEMCGDAWNWRRSNPRGFEENA